MSRVNPTKKRAGLVRANKYALKEGKTVCIGTTHMPAAQARNEAVMKALHDAYLRDKEAKAAWKALPWYKKIWLRIKRKLNG